MPAARYSRNKPLILIVDDTPANIQVMAQALAPYYELQVTTRGAKALELLQREEKPDLVLLDIMMPEMDGYEVCTRIKKMPELWGIPIIFVSAKGEVVDQQRGFALGAVDYITKPIEIPLVLARIKVHIRLKCQAECLERMAMLDGLTDIPNRKSLENTLQDEAKRASRSGKPLALLMVDVDHFKAFNDFYGHGAGDECLRSVAQVLESSLNRSSDFVARYGGEEFVVVLPECDAEGALRIARQLCRNVEALHIPHAKSATVEHVSVSIGCVSRTLENDANIDNLLKQADIALYQAKEQGRNQVVEL